MRRQRQNHHQHPVTSKGFMSEEDIEKEFSKIPMPKSPDPVQLVDWFKAHTHHPKTLDHMEKVGGLDCDLIADKYFERILTRPNPTGSLLMGYSSSNIEADMHLFKSKGKSVYLASIPLLRNGETARVIITEQHPILIPIYWVETSEAENPSLNTDEKRNEFIRNDLKGIRDISVTLDGEPIYGCVVIRNEPLEIENVPNDNILDIPADRLIRDNYTIKLHHAGLYLLLKPLSSGDHLVAFKSTAINYEMEGKIWISALV